MPRLLDRGRRLRRPAALAAALTLGAVLLPALPASAHSSSLSEPTSGAERVGQSATYDFSCRLDEAQEARGATWSLWAYPSYEEVDAGTITDLTVDTAQERAGSFTVDYTGRAEQMYQLHVACQMDDGFTFPANRSFYLEGEPAPAPVVVAPAAVTLPAAVVGTPVVPDLGTWTPSGLTYTYQWRVAGAPVGNGPAYVPTPEQVGLELTVDVTGSLPGTDAVPVTAPGGPVTIQAAPVTDPGPGTPVDPGTPGTPGTPVDPGTPAPAPVVPTVSAPPVVTVPVATPATLDVTVGGSPLPREYVVREGDTVLSGGQLALDGIIRLVLPVLAPGTHAITVDLPATSGTAATSATFQVVVTGEPVRAGGSPTATLATPKAAAAPGQRMELVAEGFDAGETVAFYLHSDPVFLGTAVAGADGVARLLATVPADVPAGAHTVYATGGTSGRWATLPIELAVPAATAAADGRLAVTGSPAGVLLAGASLLLLTGGGLLVVRRRLHAGS
ncbi:hypothetical protein [Cellulomonas sp. Marseille-Q8402]